MKFDPITKDSGHVGRAFQSVPPAVPPRDPVHLRCLQAASPRGARPVGPCRTDPFGGSGRLGRMTGGRMGWYDPQRDEDSQGQGQGWVHWEHFGSIGVFALGWSLFELGLKLLQ